MQSAITGYTVYLIVDISVMGIFLTDGSSPKWFPVMNIFYG